MATERLNFRNKYSKILFSEAIRGVKLKLCINVYDISLYINGVFLLLLLMCFRRFIMGKVKVGLYLHLTLGILTKVLQ